MVFSSTELLHSIAAIRQRALYVGAELSPEQLAHRPALNKWSIVECFTHLILIADSVQPLIADALERGEASKISAGAEFDPGLLGRLLIWIEEPPPKFRLHAPKNFVPSLTGGDPQQVIAEFMLSQDTWEKLIRDCEGQNLAKLKVASPFRGWPSLRVAAVIPWVIAHERRHLWQMEEVKRGILLRRFPRGLAKAA